MSSTSPTVAQLRAFVAVARTRHFGEAASLLGISQPTLSQSLAALEANLGVQLLERNPRQVLVTAAGTALLPLARRAVEAIDAVTQAAIPAQWLSGPLRLGIIPTIGPYLLPVLLRTLRDEAPDLQPMVHEDQTARLIEALRHGDIDVAVLALPVEDTNLQQLPVYEEDFVLAVAADDPLADARDVDPGSLAQMRLLLLDEGHCLRDQALAVCMQAGVTDAGADPARAASLPTIVQLVSAGLGVTLLPETAVQVEARGATLGIAHFAAPAPGRTIGLVFRSTSARLNEFQDLAEILRRAITGAKRPARTVGGL